MHKYIFFLTFVLTLFSPSTTKINTLQIKTINNPLTSNSEIVVPPITLTSDFTFTIWTNIQFLSHSSILKFFTLKNQNDIELGIPISNIRNDPSLLTISQLPTEASCASKTIGLKQWHLLTFSVQYQVDTTKSTKLFINDVEECSQDFTISNNNQLMHLYEINNVATTDLYLHKLRIYENRPANLANLTIIDTYPSAYYYELDSLLQHSLPSAKFNSIIFIPPTQTSPHSIVSVTGPAQTDDTDDINSSSLSSQQKSLYFNPSNRVQLRSAFPLKYNAQIMTLQVWAYSLGITSAGGSSYSRRFAFLIQVQAFFGIAINPSNELSCIEEGGSNPPAHEFTSFVVPLRQWKHLTCVLQNTSVWGYIDGTINPVTGTVSSNSNFNRKFILGTDGSDGAYFGGYLRDARVWAKHKTGGEILRDMKRSFIGAENTALIGYFPLNEQSGTQIYDYSSHHIILASANRDVTLQTSTNFAWGVLNESLTHCPPHQTPYTTPSIQECIEQNSNSSKYIKFTTIASNTPYIRTPIPVNGALFTTQPATFEMWIDPQSVQTTEQFIFQLLGTISISLISDGAAIKIDRNSLISGGYTEFGRTWTRPMGTDGVTPDPQAINSQAIQPKDWTHIAATFQITGTTLATQVLKNGVGILTQSTDVTEAINMNGIELIFGSRTGGTVNQMFVGFIAHFRMWRELRTLENIQNFMHRVLGDPSNNLISYFYFDSHHQGRTIIDNSRYLGNIVATAANIFFQSEPSKKLIVCEGTTWYDGAKCRDDNWTILREKPLHNGVTSLSYTPSLNMPATAVTQISLSIWLFIHSSRTTQKIFLDDTAGAQTATALEISLTAAGKLYTSLCAKNIEQGAVNFSSTTNAWQHVARTASASSNTLVIQGVKDNSANDLGGSFSCPANSITFQLFPADSQYLMAKEFSIFDKLLSIPDIKKLSSGMSPSYLYPLHYLKLSDANRFILDRTEEKNFFIGLNTLNKHNIWSGDSNILRVCQNQNQIANVIGCSKDTGHFFTTSIVTDVANLGAQTQNLINGVLTAKVFTLNIWIKIITNVHVQVVQSIFSVISQTNSQFDLRFTNVFSVQNSVGQIVKGSKVINCNQLCSKWINISLTQNLSDFKIYVNGFDFESITAAVQPSYSSTAPLSLSLSSTTNSFAGGIKSIHWIANQTLTSTDLLNFLLNKQLATRNFLSLSFEQSTTLTYIQQDSGQQHKQSITTGTWNQFTPNPQFQISAKLENSSQITLALPQPTTPSSNCAFSIIMVYTFQSQSQSTIFKLTTNSGATTILNFILTPSSLILSLNIDQQYNRQYDFVSDINAENSLVLGRFGSSNQFHVVINGRSLEKLLLQSCDNATDFHKNGPEIKLQSGVVLSSLSYFKASKRSSESMAKLVYQEGWRRNLVSSLMHDLLYTLSPYSSDFVSSDSKHACYLVVVTPPSALMSITPSLPFPCTKLSPIPLPKCKENSSWDGSSCVLNQNKTILSQKGTYSPVRLPIFLQSEQTEPIDLTIQFWIFSGIKPNLEVSPTTRTILEIPDYSSYKLIIQRNSSTTLQQLASVSHIATHTVNFNLPVNEWQNLAVSISSLNQISIFSNSFKIMDRKANNSMTRNQIQSLYLCGNDSDSSQMLEICSVMEVMLWNGVKGENQLRKNMHRKLSPQQKSLTFAYYSMRNGQNPYTLFEQKSGNEVLITMPHNPTTHTDYTLQPLYLNQLHTGISSLRLCDDNSYHIYGLNQCHTINTQVGTSSFVSYPHLTANKVGLAVSIPDNVSTSSTGQWTLQFWLKIITQSTSIGSFPILTQTVQNSPYGLQIQSRMTTISKIAFIPQLTQQQSIQLQSELLQQGAWGHVACRNNGLKLQGLLNLGMGSISGNFTIFSNPGSELRFGMTGMTNINRGGEFSIGRVVLWSSIRDNLALRSNKFKTINQIKSDANLIIGYQFKNGDLTNGINELQTGWFINTQDEQWIILDKIGNLQRQNLIQSHNYGAKVPVIHSQTYKLPITSQSTNKLSKSLLKRGFNLQIWVRVQSGSGGGNFITLDDFLSIGLQPHTLEYNAKFYNQTIISNITSSNQWKKLSLLHKGDSINKLQFYIKQALKSEVSITVANKDFVTSPNNYFILGDSNLIFRFKYLKLFTDYLGTTPVMKNIEESTDLHNYWLFNQENNVLYDARNNQNDEFSRTFSISDLAEVSFSNSAVVFDPNLYFCQGEEYEHDLSDQSGDFCLNRKRYLKVASDGPDLVFLSSMTTASLTNFTFQASYFVSGGSLANDGTEYKLTTLFANTDLEIKVISTNFDATTGWHHITLLYQMATKAKTIYIDTTKVLTQVIASITQPVTSPSIAVHALASPLYFYIRQLRLFSSLLTESGIKYDTLNANLIIRQYDLFAYYPLAPPIYNDLGVYTLQDQIAQYQITLPTEHIFQPITDAEGLLQSQPCKAGYSRRDSQCVSQSRVLVVKQDISQGVTIIKDKLIDTSEYTLSFWVYIASSQQYGTILSISPDIQLKNDPTNNFILKVNKSANDSEKTAMITFSRNAEWILISIGYSSDKRVKRAYLGIGDSEKRSVPVDTTPTKAKIAVFFSSSIEGFAQIDAKLGTFTVWNEYLAIGTVHRHSFTVPDITVTNLIGYWRFNSQKYQNTALYNQSQIRDLIQFTSSTTQIDNEIGLTLIPDNELLVCDNNYNFDIGQCEKQNKKLGRGVISMILVENIQLTDFTIGFWVYFPEELNAKLTVNFTPLAEMDVTTLTYIMKRGDVSVHSKVFSGSMLQKWIYVKQNGYRSVNWGAYIVIDGVVVMNENQQIETEKRVGYVGTKVNLISLVGVMNPVIRDVKIWGFSIPNHLVVNNVWSLSNINKPVYEWSFSQNSGDTIYSDSVLNPMSHILNQVQGTNYTWTQTLKTCLSNNISFCESDPSPTIVNQCTNQGKVYPWNVSHFIGCSNACQNGYTAVQNNICQQTLCYNDYIQDQQFCKQQKYVELIDASTIMQLSLGITILIFIVFGTLLRSPQGHIWALVSQLQMLYFLVFIKMKFPDNALIILKGLSFSTLGMINRFKDLVGQYIFVSRLVDDFSLGIQFTNNGVTSTIFSLLYEAKTYIFIALVIFSLLIALPCTKFCKNNKNEKCSQICSVCSGFNFWIRILCFFYLEMCFFCFIGTFNLHTTSGPYVLSTMHDLTVLMVCILLPILLTVVLFKKKDWLFQNREKFSHLIFIEQMNIETSPYLKLFYYPWYFIRRFAVALVLVYLKDAPFWQCVCIGLLSLMTVSYYIRAKPFKRLRNILDIFDELNLSLICSIIALLQQETRVLSDKQLESCGYVIVIFIFSNMGVRLIGILSELLEKCSKVDDETEKIDISKYGGKNVQRLDAVNLYPKSTSHKANQSFSNSPLKHNTSMVFQEQQEKESPYEQRKKYRAQLAARQMGLETTRSAQMSSPQRVNRFQRRNSINDVKDIERKKSLSPDKEQQQQFSPDRLPSRASIMSRATSSVSPEPQSRSPNRRSSVQQQLAQRRKSVIPRPKISSSSFYFPRKE